MSELRNVVVGVDLQESGDRAIAAALRLHHDVPGLAFHFVFAVEPDKLPDVFGEEEFDNDEEVVARAHELLRTRLMQVASAGEHSLDGDGCVVHAAHGRPHATLLRFCERHSAELLIVGTQARRGFDRLMVGSVAEALVRSAPCDVLVARQPVRPR
jgi:nucleotide-binding universal stress UspA family protein